MNNLKNTMLGIVAALALAGAGFALYSCDKAIEPTDNISTIGTERTSYQERRMLEGQKKSLNFLTIHHMEWSFLKNAVNDKKTSDTHHFIDCANLEDLQQSVTEKLE